MCARRRRRPLRSPRLSRLARPHRIALLVHAETLILVQELAPQQTARILRNSPQPLLRGLLGRPLLYVLGTRCGLVLPCVALALGLLLVREPFLALALGAIGGLILRALALRIALAVDCSLCVPSSPCCCSVGVRLLAGAFRASRRPAVAAACRFATPRVFVLTFALVLLSGTPEQIAVVARVRMSRIELERTIVFRDRLRQDGPLWRARCRGCSGLRRCRCLRTTQRYPSKCARADIAPRRATRDSRTVPRHAPLDRIAAPRSRVDPSAAIDPPTRTRRRAAAAARATNTHTQTQPRRNPSANSGKSARRATAPGRARRPPRTLRPFCSSDARRQRRR